MPSLADYQARMGAHLRGAGDAGALFAPGAISVEDGLDIYRGNVIAAATNALRLTFPTVDRIVGGAFFDQLCAKRLDLDPPRSGCLSEYNADFPNFLHAVMHLHQLPYLVDVAHFDLALERVANADRRLRSPRLALDGDTVLVLDPTLRCITLDYPADDIRAAIETDEDALPRIDMTPHTRWRAIWRDARGVELRPLSKSAGLFLGAALTDHNPEYALEQAALSGGDDVAGDIERDILRAPFARILATAE